MAFLFYIVSFPYHKNTAKNKNYTYYSPKQETFFPFIQFIPLIVHKPNNKNRIRRIIPNRHRIAPALAYPY
mgnify:CR=1 FL=1